MSKIARPIAEWLAAITEIIGIGTITLVVIYGAILVIVLMVQKLELEIIFQKVRKRIGRGILLGLEFLVAADLIHTVAVEFTYQTIGVLAIIILIRTFLSFTLEVELTGKWPWQNKGTKS